MKHFEFQFKHFSVNIIHVNRKIKFWTSNSHCLETKSIIFDKSKKIFLNSLPLNFFKKSFYQNCVGVEDAGDI